MLVVLLKSAHFSAVLMNLLFKTRNFNVRPACSSDTEAINKLVENIWMKEKLLEDLAQFNAARRDRVCPFCVILVEFTITL